MRQKVTLYKIICIFSAIAQNFNVKFYTVVRIHIDTK